MKHALLTAFWLLFTAAAQAEPGRLFFTPAERAELDRARALGLKEEQVRPAPSLKLDGVVRTPRGATVWVNGEAIRDQGVAGGMNIAPGTHPGRARLSPLETPSRPTELKVGDTLSP